MDWEVVFSAWSNADLRKIVEYIARDDPSAAARLGLTLIETAESLGSAPEMGPLLPRKASMRLFPVDAYLIIYRPDPVRCIVRILRFCHSAAHPMISVGRHKANVGISRRSDMGSVREL